MMAPVIAAPAIETGSMPRVSRVDITAALTRMISPGSGMPRLSKPITRPTVRYTASGGMVCSSASTFRAFQFTVAPSFAPSSLRPR